MSLILVIKNSPISAYINIYNLLALEKEYRKPNPIFYLLN